MMVAWPSAVESCWPIHIGKRERIDISGLQLIRPCDRAGQNCREEKILQQADEHA